MNSASQHRRGNGVLLVKLDQKKGDGQDRLMAATLATGERDR